MYHRDAAEVARIAIACRGTDEGEIRDGPGGHRRSKDSTHLEFTLADAQLDYGDPSAYVPESGEPDRGDLPRAQLLVEPTIAEFLGALYLAHTYVERCAGTAYWGGGGIRVYFSGHGAASTGALVLKDGEVSGRDLAEALGARVRRRDGTQLGVELVLDSCYSAAFLADFLAHHDPERLLPRDLWAASLHTERAWELPSLGHGALTFCLTHRGNAHADFDRLAEAIHSGDDSYVRLALQGLVPNPVTYLTERDQHAVRVVHGHTVAVPGAGEFSLYDPPFDGKFTREQLLGALDRAVCAKPRETVRGT
jgi:hypothetical protein